MVIWKGLYVLILPTALLLSGCGKSGAPSTGQGPAASSAEARVRATQVAIDLTNQRVLDESWWGHEGANGGPVPGAAKSKAAMSVESVIAGSVAKKAVIMSPPQKTGRTFQSFVVELPQRAAAIRFEMGIPNQPVSISGVTVIYSVRVIGKDGDKLVWETRYGKSAWEAVEVDLSAYAGQPVTIRLLNTWDAESKGYTGPAAWATPEILGP